MIQQNFIELYENSFKKYWNLPAITNYNNATTYTYANVARTIAKVHLLLKEAGVQKGDKISLIGKDSAEWCMVYLGVITYGAIIVPILQDFHANDILHIIEHSDSRVVFVSQSHYKVMDPSRMGAVSVVIDIDSLKPLEQFSINKSLVSLDVEALFQARYPNDFTKEDIAYPHISNDEVMLINYTSGTTGYSKGVILTANNLAGNVTYANYLKLMFEQERVLCFLPMAHAYSCAFNFLTPIQCGTHIYVLGTTPTPSILVKALKDVKPHLIISVPLILEKIYKNVITPKISKGAAKFLIKTPLLSSVVYKKVRDTLFENMGGNFREFIVGGAALNEEVVDFLKKAKFPFTVGYGMTECAPLISYEHHQKYVANSCGKPLKEIMEVRIFEPDSATGIGEIQVRGENVCKGYYKNAEETEKLFTADGWLRTGDLGYMDRQKNIFIKGRSKTMLLGPSGQNIYTEGIEAKLTMMEYVGETLIVMNSSQKLVALIYPDVERVQKEKLTTEQLEQIMKQNIAHLNEQLASYEQVASFVLRDEEFEKTPKRSIKRFLYTDILTNP